LHTVDFNIGTTIDPNGIASYSGTFIFNGDTRPTNDPSTYLDVSVGQRTTINFTDAIDYFGLYWGTPDNGPIGGASQPVNIITFNNVVGNNVVQLAQFTPGSIPGFNPADFSLSTDDAYVSFNASGETFNQVVLTQSGANQFGAGGFETDNHSYVTVSVPAPSIGSGLPALLAIGGAWILHLVFLRLRGEPVKAALGPFWKAYQKLREVLADLMRYKHAGARIA
jgi:hypothetical protein